MTEYEQFLKQKMKAHVHSGFDLGELNKNLFPFQEFIVRRADLAKKNLHELELSLKQEMLF